jgi:hypothetical protein
MRSKQRLQQSSPFKVYLIAEVNKQIIAISGLRLSPDVTINEYPELDISIIPGG